MKDPIMTVDEAARVLQLHPFTVLKLIRAKKIKASKIGRVYRLRESAIDAFLDSYSN